MRLHSPSRVFASLPGLRAVTGQADWCRMRLLAIRILTICLLVSLAGGFLFAQESTPVRHGGEANLVLPDLDQAKFMDGVGGRSLLMGGLAVGLLGLLFG